MCTKNEAIKISGKNIVPYEPRQKYLEEWLLTNEINACLNFKRYDITDWKISQL